MVLGRMCCSALMFHFMAAGQPAAPDPLASATPADIAAGKRLFDSQCVLCHGAGGSGGRGPALTRSKLRRAADSAELIDLLLGGVNGMPGFWFLGEKAINQVAAYVRSLGAQPHEASPPGNAERGKAIYESSGCAGCHIIRGEGSAFGPDLSEIGAQRSVAYLREALTDPGASLPEDFAAVQVVLHDGKKVEGVRLNEDSFTIQLRDAAGQFHSFRKEQLSGIRKQFTVSPMPSYRGKLSDSDIDDVVSWLASLKEKP